MGAHSVLHTHSRKLDDHPYVHLIAPAGAIDEHGRKWRQKKGKVLFWANNLATVFRAKWFDAMRLGGSTPRRRYRVIGWWTARMWVVVRRPWCI